MNIILDEYNLVGDIILWGLLLRDILLLRDVFLLRRLLMSASIEIGLDVKVGVLRSAPTLSPHRPKQ